MVRRLLPVECLFAFFLTVNVCSLDRVFSYCVCVTRFLAAASPSLVVCLCVKFAARCKLGGLPVLLVLHCTSPSPRSQVDVRIHFFEAGVERFVSLKVLDHVVYPHKHTKAEWGDEDRIPKWKHRNYKEKNYLS
jgi:hypothetical protein